MTFGMGAAVPSVVLSPPSRSWASATLSRGRRDCEVVAALSILQGICGSTIATVLWFPAPTASCMEGDRWNKNMARKYCCLDWHHEEDAAWVSHEDAGLEALHLHGESEQFKIGLAICSFRTAQAKSSKRSQGWSDSLQTSTVSKMSRCLAWAGWPEHWHLMPAVANCFSKKQNQMAGSSSS